MPGIARVGDKAFGHPTYNETYIASGAQSVSADNLAIARKGDICTPHTNGPDTHVPIIATCSDTVFIESIGAARIGDVTDCNSIILDGSGSVYAN